MFEALSWHPRNQVLSLVAAGLDHQASVGVTVLDAGVVDGLPGVSLLWDSLGVDGKVSCTGLSVSVLLLAHEPNWEAHVDGVVCVCSWNSAWVGTTLLHLCIRIIDRPKPSISSVSSWNLIELLLPHLWLV